MCYFFIPRTQRPLNTEGYHIRLYPFCNPLLMSIYSVSGTGLQTGDNEQGLAFFAKNLTVLWRRLALLNGAVS